jgi:very-short-patch-repair endonuclease
VVIDHLIGFEEIVMSDVIGCSVGVTADIASCFTYASFQNAIPVIRSIKIDNPTLQIVEDCQLHLVATPAFIRAKTWTIDRILAGDSITITDRKVDLDASYLSGLNEAERGEITLTLSARGTTLDQIHVPVRLLARDEWGGVDDMAQLLPAFVMPNDPAVARVMRSAADQLAAHGHSSALDGYQSRDPKRVFMLSAAIYSAVSALGIHYAEPPASFEHRGQKVRRPTDILEQQLATCLDLTLLLASALEASGLHSVILMFNGHAAVGVWLNQRTLTNAIEHDLMEIRKALALRELLVFETTGLTHRPAMVLNHAQKLVEARMDEGQREKFVAAIDVRRARSGGIIPLASHEPTRRAVEEVGATSLVALPLPAMPVFDVLPTEVAEEKPTTAAGRIDRWQKKLLDLTLRNRLLNFPDTQKTIPFICTDVAYLEDRLASGASIRLISLPDQNPVGERDEALFRETRGEDLQRHFATEALQRDELPSKLHSKELEKRLIELHRQVKNDFAEGGANTLFLAVGFLRWKKKPVDDRSYRAPLLLVPVKLERKSASSRFALRFHEDEPRFNATLLQFLERDFDLRLPQFSAALPLDESGIDVPRLLASMRQAVRDVPGMEVVDEVALSTFSFAKFLMWKDLVERTDVLRQNRVVKHLIDTPEQTFSEGQTIFVEEREIDRRFDPKDIICLLPADSSQIAVSMAAAEGRDFVVVGPPGTGKSQTIANMIANCLAVGKTVLFVAEKTAALDVVYRRLREHGLGDYCLELHSSKADRKSFVSQLKQAWQASTRSDDREWIQVNEGLRLRRDKLNGYVESLHKRHPNGLSAYKAIGITSKGAERHSPKFSFSSRDAHDEHAYDNLAMLAGELGRVYGAVQRQPSFDLVDKAEWSSGWQEQLLSSAAAINQRIDRLQQTHRSFIRELSVAEETSPSFESIERLVNFAESLGATAGTDVSVAFDRDFGQLHGALAELSGAISAYRSAAQALSASFAHDTLASIPIEQLENDWREASASIWPKSWLGKRRVEKLFQSYAETGTPDPERDLATLKRMRQQSTIIDGNGLAGTRAGFDGLRTDLALVERRLSGAQRIRDSLSKLGKASEEVRVIVQTIAPALVSASSDVSVHLAARDFVEAFADFVQANQHFSSVAGTDLAVVYPRELFSTLPRRLAELAGARQMLRDWVAWCQVRQQAVAKGLVGLVEDIESGAIAFPDSEAAFHLGYARWWLPLAIDADPVLREFRRFQHEHALMEFRQIDDLVRKAAAGKVSSVLAHGFPPIQGVPRQSELGLLRYQMELQRPSRSIREMIGGMPGSFSKLAPCMLMSPLSIAQYLPPDQALFDVVIFDEASQITTWDAVGAIARGRQTIIVGDPKQLPPTNFFGRNEGEEEVEEHERDLESILDEAKNAGIPVRDLRWHYRSRNESLIAFSNHYYYQNRLITFPSPQVEDRAVSLRPVLNGVYDRGKSRTNRIEARAVADEGVKRMRSWLKLPEGDRPTLGIITFNAQQQSLIQDFLDEARRDFPELEWFFSEIRIEPTIVKNLENVQGDERDTILFSITFTEDAAGKRTMDFGALNRDGGERRLNVAVTRARQELLVFSGFRADQIDVGRTKAVGVHHLKAFLDFAERGADALPAQDEGSVGGLESPFEEAVAEELSRRGWHIVPQVGISGFRIDIGIKHPDKAGTYLAGVECDGATYHSSATARDRDKVREQVLRGLGWQIVRVWSTDWWFDCRGAADRMHQALCNLLDESRAIPEPVMEETVDQGSIADEVASIIYDDEQPTLFTSSQGTEDLIELGQLAADVSGSAILNEPQIVPGTDGSMYHVADLTRFTADPDSFFEFSYRSILMAMIEAVIEAEAPMREDVLAQRVARAHGWLRTGSRIRERIALHLKDLDRTEESSGTFVWKKGTVTEVRPYRTGNGEGRRSISDTPLSELTAIVIANRGLLDETDPALSMARVMGVERLAATSRARLEEAITKARLHLSTDS